VLGVRKYLARAVLKELTDMMDVLVLAIGIAFFALSIAYAYACERL